MEENKHQWDVVMKGTKHVFTVYLVIVPAPLLGQNYVASITIGLSYIISLQFPNGQEGDKEMKMLNAIQKHLVRSKDRTKSSNTM